MKKLFTIISLIFIVSACYTSEDQKQLQSECRALAAKKEYLQRDVNHYSEKIASLQSQINDLNTEKRIINSGREPKYIVKFRIKQGTFTLDIFEHIKNEVNAIDIEVPVDKDFYNRLSVGQDITNAFKYGSLIFNGDFSTLHMKVTGKRIE